MSNPTSPSLQPLVSEALPGNPQPSTANPQPGSPSPNPQSVPPGGGIRQTVAFFKKRRADSPLWSLPEDQQALLFKLLESQSLDAVVVAAANIGIPTSRSALSRFRHGYFMQCNCMADEAAIEALALESADDQPQVTSAQLFELGQRRLMARAIRMGDDKSWARIHRLRQQEEMLELQRTRLQALEERNQLLREHRKSSPLPVPNDRWNPVGQGEPAEFANGHTPVPATGRAPLPRRRNAPPPQPDASGEPNTLPASDPSVLSVPFPSAPHAVAAVEAEALAQVATGQPTALNPASSHIIPPLAA
jgi:hypothetical protein